MARKSSIARKPEVVRATIDKMIRQGRLTLDEIVTYVEEKHGPGAAPSRSALGRYAKSVNEMMERMRSIDTASRAIVEELGESPDDRAGALLVQSITTMATDVAMRLQADDDGEGPSIEDVRKLARAGNDIMRTRKLSLQERQEIARLAREKLLAEQADKLDKEVRSGGLTAAAANDFRKKILGVG